MEQMRDTMTPLQMAKWKAFREIQPDVRERICTILKRGLCAVANSMGGELEPDVLEPCPEKYEPEPEVNQGQAEQLITMGLGPPNGNRNR